MSRKRRRRRTHRKTTTKPATPRQEARRSAAARVITTMRRDGISLARALRGSGVTRQTVMRFAGSALQCLPNGRYVARPSDRLTRVIHVLTDDGERDIAVRGSKTATLVAEHWNAVHRYLATGDASALQRFKEAEIGDAEGTPIHLMTDRTMLDHLGRAGVLSFESIYPRTA